MAFVYRSSKLKDNKINEQTGPGSYLSHTTYAIKENKKPFLSSSSKGKEIMESKVSPGPGSYFKDGDNYLKTELNNLLTSQNNKSPVYKVLDYDEMARNSKFAEIFKDKIKPTGFLNKDKRFVEPFATDNTPGPGHYNRTDLNFFEEKYVKKPLLKNKIKINNQHKNSEEQETHEFKGAVSIPAKMQSYGYKVIGEGEIVRNDNKGMQNEISPYSYDIFNYTKNQWHNKTLTGIWSRSKTEKGIQLTNKEKSQSKNKDFNNSNAFGYTSNSILTAPSTTAMFYEDKIYSQPQKQNQQRKTISNEFKRNLTLNNIKKCNIERKVNFKSKSLEKNNLEEIIANETEELPGPGYYFNSLETEIKTKPESFQCFGSRTSRFTKFNDNTFEDQPGPGSYFNQKEIKLTKKKMKNNKDTNRINLQRSLSNQPSSKAKVKTITPGPCDYEPLFDSNLQKKKVLSTTKGIFGSTEKRFVKNKFTYEETQGPGAYIPVFEVQKKSNQLNHFRTNLKKERMFDQNKENAIQFVKQIETCPSVGTYDPDKLFNIETKLKKNVNKVSSVFAPFNSLQRRFEKVKKDKYKLNLGPGYYYKERKVEYKQIGQAFNSTSVRDNENEELKPIGPGNYNLTGFYDWNKKSYNVHFV
jgi:hypothetical protein